MKYVFYLFYFNLVIFPIIIIRLPRRKRKPQIQFMKNVHITLYGHGQIYNEIFPST